MNNIYIFSKGNFLITANNLFFDINKNSICKITNAENNQITISNDNGFMSLQLNNLKTCNHYRTWMCQNNIFIEIIATSFNNLIQKEQTKNFEVWFYNNAIRIISFGKCFTYHFLQSKTSYAFEEKNNLYLFNNKNLIIFNSENNCFSSFTVKEFKKNNKNIELLCKIPQNYCNFIYFLFNFEKNIITIKKLQDNKLSNSYIPLPYIIFNLGKNDFKNTNELVSKNVPIENVISYFKTFDGIVEIENSFFLYNQTKLTEINFKIENNIIIDID